MKSIIVGGGKIGYYLLKTLYEQSYNIVLIESNYSICKSIADELNINIICGDGTDLDVLRDAGIDEAEVVAAVTGSDEENLVICKIAKSTFHIAKTIAKINNPKNISMFKALGVDRTVCSTAVIANLIEYEFDKDNVRILQTFDRGAMILIEIQINKDSVWTNEFVKDLDLPEECVMSCILRDEKAIYPRGNTRIQENDNILILTNNSGFTQLKRLIRDGGNKFEKTRF